MKEQRMKLHLGARAPNEGARQLARWIMREHGGCLKKAVAAIRGVGVATLERVIVGEVVPGAVLAEQLGRAARIDRRRWRWLPQGGWFDAEPTEQARAA